MQNVPVLDFCSGQSGSARPGIGVAARLMRLLAARETVCVWPRHQKQKQKQKQEQKRHQNLRLPARRKPSSRRYMGKFNCKP
jgi:hypothetical protein